MKDSEKKTIKMWIDTWKTASSSLKKIKSNELQSVNYYQKNQILLNEMLHYAFDHRTVRLSSGLIEMQKIFKKYHQSNIT